MIHNAFKKNDESIIKLKEKFKKTRRSNAGSIQRWNYDANFYSKNGSSKSTSLQIFFMLLLRSKS